MRYDAKNRYTWHNVFRFTKGKHNLSTYHDRALTLWIRNNNTFHLVISRKNSKNWNILNNYKIKLGNTYEFQIEVDNKKNYVNVLINGENVYESSTVT